MSSVLTIGGMDLPCSLIEKIEKEECIAVVGAGLNVLGDDRAGNRVKYRYDCLALTNWKGVITTNLDEQVRAGFTRVGRPLDFVLAWYDVKDANLLANLVDQKNWIIQLHGTRFRPDDAVLTEADYTLVWGRQGNSWDLGVVGPTVMRALTGKTALFVGYSFEDNYMFPIISLGELRRQSLGEWFAVLPEDKANSSRVILETLSIKPISYPNRKGMHEEVDELLRGLPYFCPVTRVDGTREAGLRRLERFSLPVNRHAVAEDSNLMKTFAATETIHIGDLDTTCQLFPTGLRERGTYSGSHRRTRVFFDDGEAENQIHMEYLASEPPPVERERLINELDEALSSASLKAEDVEKLRDVLLRLKEGQNPYPRLSAIPKFKPSGRGEFLEVTLAPSTYGLSLLTERSIDLPCLADIKGRVQTNSLAVMIAYTYTDPDDNARYCVFHQRKGEQNASWKEAWTIGASGYIDPKKHSEFGRISPWLAAAYELEEELNIRREYLPNREHYKFFGVARATERGFLDVIGECTADYVPHFDRP
ncbi:MAG: SIR2 family protein, partial [Nitrososphaera sp.]|nr:SIR2 family protein [Nitrososphaera sp.]